MENTEFSYFAIFRHADEEGNLDDTLYAMGIPSEDHVLQLINHPQYFTLIRMSGLIKQYPEHMQLLAIKTSGLFPAWYIYKMIREPL